MYWLLYVIFVWFSFCKYLSFYDKFVDKSLFSQRLATADPVAQAEFSSTEEWLGIHGIDQSGLDFKTLLNKGIVR